MSNITIGFTEPVPDKKFIGLVQKIIAAEQDGDLLGKEKQKKAATTLAEHDLKDTEHPINLGTSLTIKNNYRPAYHYALTNNSLLNIKENPLKDTRFFIVDITKTFKHVQLIRSLAKTLKNTPSAFLLLDPRSEAFEHIVLKYDGTPASVSSILAFPKLFPTKAQSAEKVTLISPVNFKKSQIPTEKQFVKNAAYYYGVLGFIKLPLNTVKDFFNYAAKSHIDLLILPKQDLTETLKIVTSKHFHSMLKQQSLSIFIG